MKTIRILLIEDNPDDAELIHITLEEEGWNLEWKVVNNQSALQEALNPLGVAVVMEAQHMCMMIRGVQKQNSKAITSAVLGLFREDPSTKAEWMSLLQTS